MRYEIGRFHRPIFRGVSGSELLFNSTGVSCSSTAAPDQPTGLTATAVSTSQINLAWTADSTAPPNAATYYVVERSPDGSTGWAQIGMAMTNALNDTGLPASTQFYYRVSAYNCFGGSTPSATANATTQAAIPAAPTGVSASASTTVLAVTITWTDASTNETGFYVYRNTSNTTVGATQVNSVAAGVQTYTDNAANSGGNAPADGTTYYYWVSAYNGSGESSLTAASQNSTGGVTTAIVPEWTLDFSSGTPSGYTLTRASSGTYVDSSGYIASQASGASGNSAARLTHNSSGTRLGLLVEEQRANILPNSEDFATTWTGGNCNVSTNAVNAPTNTLVADKIAANTTNASHWLRRSAVGPVAGTTYVFSVFFKAGGGAATHAVLNIETTGTDRNYSAKYDTSTGARTDTDLINSPVNTDSPTQAEDFGNGWWRAWVRIEHSTGNTGLRAYVGLSNVATGSALPSFAGAAGDADFIYFWGAQVEASTTTPTAFIPTTTATVTRSADLAHVLDSSITSWGDPGALVVHFYPPGQAGTLISTDDMANQQLGIQASSTTAARAFWSSGNTATGTIGTGVQKAVHYWNGSTSKFAINGSTPVSGTNNITTFGNIDFVTFGAEATESGGVPVPPPPAWQAYANCIIRKIEFHSGTLTDANLQTITT